MLLMRTSMGRVVVGVLLAVLAQTLGARSSALDNRITEVRLADLRVLPPCAAGAAVAQIGRQARIPVGFESTRDCWLSPRLGGQGDNVEVLRGVTARQAFDYLIARRPTFSWRDMDGVAVVRPVAAWDDAADVLNLPVMRFEIADAPVDDVLHTVLRAVTPPVYFPHADASRPKRPVDRPVTVAFPGGTMLTALNAVVRARHDIEWQLGYGAGRATVVLGALDVDGGVVMAPVAVPQARP